MHQQDTSIHRTYRSSCSYLFDFLSHFVLLKHPEYLEMCSTLQPVTGSKESLDSMHAWHCRPHLYTSGLGRAALLWPQHIWTWHTQRKREDCINNTYTNVQYALWYTGRHALLHERASMHPHSCIMWVYVYLNAHTCSKTNCMLNHDISWVVEEETCVSSNRLRRKYEQVLQLFEF